MGQRPSANLVQNLPYAHEVLVIYEHCCGQHARLIQVRRHHDPLLRQVDDRRRIAIAGSQIMQLHDCVANLEVHVVSERLEVALDIRHAACTWNIRQHVELKRRHAVVVANHLRLWEHLSATGVVVMLMRQHDSRNRGIRQLGDLLLHRLCPESNRRVGNQHAIIADHNQAAHKESEVVVHAIR